MGWKAGSWINICMKPTFTQFLIERISVPQSALQQALAFVSDAYMNYDGTPRKGTINFSTEELPDRYRIGVKLQKSHPIQIHVGEYGDSTKGTAEYFPMGGGTGGRIVVNLSKIQKDDKEAGLEEIESHLAHELQHVTQDSALRKKHPKQMQLPGAEDTEDQYYGSDIEFHPQITTALGEFKRQLRSVRQQKSTDAAQTRQLLNAYINPTAQMPEGFLRYKRNWASPFFASLYNNDPQKWKKAVKELHRLIQS